MYDLAPKIDKRPKIFHTLFLPNLSHKRYRTAPYRTILYVTVFKKYYRYILRYISRYFLPSYMDRHRKPSLKM